MYVALSTKREGEVAIITGSDSGIGQAMAVEFAKEGADVAITYLHDAQGAEETRRQVEAEGRRAIVVQTNLREEPNVARLFRRPRHSSALPTSW